MSTLFGMLGLAALFAVLGAVWWGETRESCPQCPEADGTAVCGGCPLAGGSDDSARVGRRDGRPARVGLRKG